MQIRRLCVLLLLSASCSETPPARTTPGPDGNAATDLTTRAPVAHFLTAHGPGSASEANQYYARGIAGFSPDSYTLDAWRDEWIGTAPVYRSYYKNQNELGVWRDMTCTQDIGRGYGGCVASDWLAEGDKDAKKPSLGSAAMVVNAAGVAEFFAFTPEGVLTASISVDSEGAKFVPETCTVCHAGRPKANDNDLGSVFREFEASALLPPTGVDPAEAEQELFLLNQAITAANQALRSEAEGAPKGADAAKAAILAHLGEMYPMGAPPALSVDDPALIPPSWLKVSDPAAQAATSALFTAVVNPYCNACHRIGRMPFANFADFAGLHDAGTDAVPLLRAYLSPNTTNRTLPFMPQSEVGFQNLQTDGVAQAAMDAWLNAAL